MPALSKVKTWAHTDVTVAGGSGPVAIGSQSDGDRGNRQMLWEIKEAMIGGNWTVVSSSGWNGSGYTAGSGDNWTTSTNVNWENTGEHGWIVLQNNAINTGWQLLIDLEANDLQTELISAWVSYSAGFTGGTTSARPTATDEWQMLNGATWSDAGTSSRGASVFQSSDGEATRFVTSYNTGSLRLWMFDKMPLINTAWTKRYIAFGTLAPTLSALNYTNVNVPFESPSNGVLLGFMTTLVSSAGSDSINSTILNGVDVNGNWVAPQIGMASKDSAFPGFLSQFTDLWFIPDGPADGDYIPSGGSRDYVIFGNVVMPNDGSIVTIS